jgi:hypothetical protein
MISSFLNYNVANNQNADLKKQAQDFKYTGEKQGLEFKVQPTKYPGTKKRPYPFNLGSGQMPSAHKSETDLKHHYGTPGGFDDNLDDYAIDPDKIIEEDEESEFHD